MDLSGITISLSSAAVLSDVFTIEWGLRKLIFKECDLDEYVGLAVGGLFSRLMLVFRT